MNKYERQKYRILKDELPVGAKYATGEEWRNKLQKEWRDGAKEKQYPVVDVIDDESKVWYYKE